jgi:alpha-galactosidase
MKQQKLAFIGAGSFVFTRKLVIDLFSYPDMPPTELALMDIDPDRLKTVEMLVRKIIEQEHRPVTLTVTTDRQRALDGAHYVLAMYEPHGLEARRREVMTCIAHGLPLAIGDTLNPSGFFKAVRTGVVALSVAADMARLCPDALFMNYVNPMATNCGILNAATKIRTVGMCHGMEHTRALIAKWLDVPLDELQVRGAGINHMTWLLEIRRGGEDLYPRLWEQLPTVRAEDPVRAAIMEATGYFVTESSYHSAEYVPYFRTWFKPLYITDQPMAHCNQGMGGWGGQIIYPTTGPIGRTEPAIPLGWDIYLYEKHHSKTWETAKRALLEESTVKIERSEEYAMRIVHSLATGAGNTMSLNVPNAGYISNLPDGATVELPVRADGDGLHAQTVRDLPELCAALCRRNIEVQARVIQAVQNQDAGAVFHAMLLDPLTGASLDLAGIEKLFNALIDVDREMLPDWLRKGKRDGSRRPAVGGTV